MKITITNICEAGHQDCQFNGRMVNDGGEYALIKKVGNEHIAIRFNPSKHPIEILIDDSEVTIYFRVSNEYVFSFDVFFTRSHERQLSLKEFIEA